MKAGATVTGVDPSAGLTAIARDHASELEDPPPLYVCDTIENHAARYPQYYDVVVASEVVEHVPNKESFLTACVSALKVVCQPTVVFVCFLYQLILYQKVKGK